MAITAIATGETSTKVGRLGTAPTSKIANPDTGVFETDAVTLTARGTVTQATSATTGVTVNATSGAITTVTQNIAAAGEVEFVVTNNTVAANSVPVVAIASGSTGGTTIASVKAVAAGSFTVVLTNLHATVAETGTLVINFAVLGSAA